jgi:uncharacterized protein YggE
VNGKTWAGIGAIAATLATLAVAESVTAQDRPVGSVGPRTIRVSGTGQVQVRPDMATIQFAVETTGMTAQAAAEANADLMDRVIQALRGAGVANDDIRTSGYSLYPEYAIQTRDDPNAPPQIRGYRASNQVTVRSTNLDGLGALIDVGLAAGANRMNGVSFELRDSEAARAEALREAVVAARASAETIANALGVTLGAVIDASTSADPVRPVYQEYGMAMDMRMSVAAAPTPIQPGEQTVTAVASIIYEIQ